MVDVLFVNQPRIGEIPVPREIDCSNPQQDFLIQPLGLTYLAGAVKRAGLTARIIDASALKKKYDWVEEVIEKEKPKIIIGGFTAPSIKVDMKLGEIAEKYNVKFGIWGPLPSAMRDHLFDNFKLDFIIENEPEFCIEEIAKKLKKKSKNLFKNVKGISYNNNGNVVWNGYRELVMDLNKLPVPAFELLDMKLYHTPYNRRLPMTLLRTSRGCVAKCIFCITGGQTDKYRGYGMPWRAYNADRVLKEIKIVVKQGVKEINFFDAEFTINKKRVIEICKKLIENKIDVIWNCNARADMVDEEALKWMKKAGCYSISYGMESANKGILKTCKKNVSPEQVERAVVMTKKAGIQPALFLMMGLPGENEKTIQETIQFGKKMALKYNLRPQCTIATPYPGTVFYEMAKKEGWIKEDFDKLEQTTASIAYPHLNQEQLEHWHDKFYRKVVLHPKRLVKRALRIRHWNEVKNLPVHLKDFVYGFLNQMKYLR